MNKWQKLLVAAASTLAVMSLTTGRAEAAKIFNGETHTPTSHRGLCSTGTPVDFSAYPSNVGIDLNTGVISYNINIQWGRCPGGGETRAYAVYSSGFEVCPISGTYGAAGFVTDCVKYIGNPPYQGAGNGLSCAQGAFGLPGTNDQCVTQNFSGVRRSENQPSSITSVTIPMQTVVPNWGSVPDDGTWNIGNAMCQFYKTGSNFTNQVNNRCINIAMSISWRRSIPAPTLTIKNTCTGIWADTNGYQVHIYDSTGGIGIISNPPDRFDLEPTYAPGKVIDVYGTPDGINTQGNKHETWTWQPQPLPPETECRRDFMVAVSATVSVDSENPTVADFYSSARLVSGPTSVSGISVGYEYYIVKQGTKGRRVTIGGGPQNLDRTGASYPLDDVDLSGYGLIAGDQVCAELSADPGSGEVNQNGVFTRRDPVKTARECKIIKDRPYLSVYGADVKAGGNFIGAGNCQGAADVKTYTRSGMGGSGVQFAAWALGEIVTDAGQAKGFNSARLRSSAPTSPLGLTFANTNAASPGRFGGSNCLPSYMADAPTSTPQSATTVNLNGLASGNYYYPNSITLEGRVGPGVRVRLYVADSVRITNNTGFQSDSGWTKVGDIPSIQVIASDIYIEPNVSEITGTYVAQPGSGSGTIVTCTQPGQNRGVAVADLASTCRNQLTIYGSFIAQKVHFLRAANSLRNAGANEATPGGSQAAERFVMSPDQYLVAPDPVPGTPADNRAYDSFTGLPPIL